MPASEERSISEFPSALAILATTLLFVSTYDSGNDTYDSEKVSAVDLASAILGDFEYTQDLATNVKTIFGAINSIMVLSGTTVPSSASGANGQLYFKYTSSGGTDTVDAMYLKINNAWCEVATGGGGGASVTLGTTVPSDASGSNGDLYVQYDGTSYAVVNYFVKINNAWRVAPYSKVIALTQAQYNQITPDSQTLYIITDAQSSYQTKTDNTLDTTDKTVVGAINELKSDCDNNHDYTINETAIGSWFGVKAIYRKYIDIGTLPNNSTKQTEFYNGEIQDLINLRIIAKTIAGDSFVSIPYLSSSSTFNIECDVEVSNSKSYVNITTHRDASSLVAFAIVEYTKK